MHMIVMAVVFRAAVDMAVTMVHRLVVVRMRMAFADVQPDAQRHQPTRQHQSRREGFAEQEHGQRGAEKRRHGEIRACARRTQMPQRQHEQHQADAVAGKAERACRQHDRPSRPLRPDQHRQKQVDRPGDEPLAHGDKTGIGQGDFAREVVVERPAQAGADHRQPRPQTAPVQPHPLAGPVQHHTTQNNGPHAQGDAAIEVFAEHKPGQQGRQHALQIEQQRSPRGRHAREAEHQQHRRAHTAAENRGGQPGPLTGLQMRRRRFAAAHGTQCPPGGQADPRAQIQQGRQQPRAGVGQQQLGQRRARAEQQGGDERQGDALMERSVLRRGCERRWHKRA